MKHEKRQWRGRRRKRSKRWTVLGKRREGKGGGKYSKRTRTRGRKINRRKKGEGQKGKQRKRRKKYEHSESIRKRKRKTGKEKEEDDKWRRIIRKKGKQGSGGRGTGRTERVYEIRRDKEERK